MGRKRNEQEAAKENPGDVVLTVDQIDDLNAIFDQLGDFLDEVDPQDDED